MAQYHKGDLPPSKVLLMAHVLVAGQKHVETGPLRLGQQVAIGQRIPSSVFGLNDGVGRQESGDAGRRYVVKENEHPRGDWQRGRGPGQGYER